MSAATFDDSAWPVVKVKLVGGFSEDDLKAYLEGLRGLMMRGKFAAVVDLGQVQKSSPAVYEQWKRWFSQFGTVFSQSCKGIGYVVSGLPSGAVMKAMTSQEVSCPIRAHATVALAEKWLAEGPKTK